MEDRVRRFERENPQFAADRRRKRKNVTVARLQRMVGDAIDTRKAQVEADGLPTIPHVVRRTDKVRADTRLFPRSTILSPRRIRR